MSTRPEGRSPQGRKGARRLTADEHTLWNAITRSVAPLRRRPPAPADEPPAEPVKRAKPAKASHPHPVSPAPPPVKPPPLAPLDRRMRQRIARDREPIDARIDLHGMRQNEAHAALRRFLRGAQADGARIVLVITGKGARTDDPAVERGVLRRQVPLWLESADLRPIVVGFEAAHMGHGGEGALYVRIRRAR